MFSVHMILSTVTFFYLAKSFYLNSEFPVFFQHLQVFVFIFYGVFFQGVGCLFDSGWLNRSACHLPLSRDKPIKVQVGGESFHDIGQFVRTNRSFYLTDISPRKPTRSSNLVCPSPFDFMNNFNLSMNSIFCIVPQVIIDFLLFRNSINYTINSLFTCHY